MGSSNSRLGRTGVERRKTRLASFFCGTSLSQSHLDNDDQMGDNLCEAPPDSIGRHDSIVKDDVENPVKNSSRFFPSESECSSSIPTSESSCTGSDGIHVDDAKDFNPRAHVSSDPCKCLSEIRRPAPFQADASHRTVECYEENKRDVASTSKEPQSLASTNGDTRSDAIAPVGKVRNEESFLISTDGSCSSSVPLQEAGDANAIGLPSDQSHAADPGFHYSESGSTSAVVNPSLSSGLVGDESFPEISRSTSYENLLPSNGISDHRSGSLLHVDVVSISSGTLPSGTEEAGGGHEARRNSRRLFWDAFSRRGSGRNSDSPTIIFSTEDTDDMESHNRWLLDFSSDLFDNGFGDLGYHSNRNHSSYFRRWHSRSEIWERLHGSSDEHRRRTTFCASGLHPDGTCSCETFLMSDDFGARASISRIVMLAEALFEVLDEIHRQPISLSFSMVSLPAPESVVDSFPIKSHTGSTTPNCGDDVEQCYICLAEYEEGDKIRVLPCRHEYHMLCVDKWLKEIHGVCPLCRRSVCEGSDAGFVSSS